MICVSQVYEKHFVPVFLDCPGYNTVVGYLQRGDMGLVLEYMPDWAKVQSRVGVGWVCDNYVSVEKTNR